MNGMILAAGFGTRLRPLTWTTPKPMVPLCNRPLVAWAVESYLAAGVDRIVVNLHHLPEPIERFLRDEYGRRAALHFSIEEEILGTGGGVRRVAEELHGGAEFFLVNGDTVQFPRYAELRESRRTAGALASLTLRHPPSNDRFTAVWLDDGRVTGFGEGSGEALMFAGSHAIAPEVFPLMPDEEVFGIVDRVYQPAIAAGRTIGGIVDDGLWFDVGTPARYLDASEGLLAALSAGELRTPAGSSMHGTSLTDDSTRVAGTLDRSTIGARCAIEGDVRRSIVWSDCRIGPGVRLERCIVADGVELSGGMELRDAVICRDHEGIPADLPRRAGLVIV